MRGCSFYGGIDCCSCTSRYGWRWSQYRWVSGTKVAPQSDMKLTTGIVGSTIMSDIVPMWASCFRYLYNMRASSLTLYVKHPSRYLPRPCQSCLRRRNGVSSLIVVKCDSLCDIVICSLGAPIGGLINDSLNWRWAFWVQVCFLNIFLTQGF